MGVWYSNGRRYGSVHYARGAWLVGGHLKKGSTKWKSFIEAFPPPLLTNYPAGNLFPQLAIGRQKLPWQRISDPKMERVRVKNFSRTKETYENSNRWETEENLTTCFVFTLVIFYWAWIKRLGDVIPSTENLVDILEYEPGTLTKQERRKKYFWVEHFITPQMLHPQDGSVWKTTKGMKYFRKLILRYTKAH